MNNKNKEAVEALFSEIKGPSSIDSMDRGKNDLRERNFTKKPTVGNQNKIDSLIEDASNDPDKLATVKVQNSRRPIKSGRFIKSGAGAGYDVTIKDIELDTNNIEILESTADSVHVKVPVKPCIVEWKAEDYYNSVSSDGIEIDYTPVLEYGDDDKRIDGGYVQFTIDVWENESAEDIINNISRVVPDYIDFTAQYGWGWLHVNLPEEGMNFEYKDIKNHDVGAYGEIHLDSVELKCPNISENINWFFAHDHELEDIFFGDEEEDEEITNACHGKSKKKKTIKSSKEEWEEAFTVYPWDVNQVSATSDEDLGLSYVVGVYGDEYVNVDDEELEAMKDELVRYFDDEAFVRDWNINYPNYQIDSFYDVYSDPEELSVDELARYFDYDAFGRDLRISERMVWDNERECWFSANGIEISDDDNVTFLWSSKKIVKSSNVDVKEYMKAKDLVKKLEKNYNMQKRDYDYTQRVKDTGSDITMMFPHNVKPTELERDSDYVAAKQIIDEFENSSNIVKSSTKKVIKSAVLSRSERESLEVVLSFITGILGEDEDVKKYSVVRDSLSSEEINKLEDVCNYVFANEQDYKNISTKILKDDLPLLRKVYGILDKNDLLEDNYDAVSGFEKLVL